MRCWFGFHKWSKWTDPLNGTPVESIVSKQSVLIQKRWCLICNLQKWRFYGN